MKSKDIRFEIQLLHKRLTSEIIDLRYDKTIADKKLETIASKYNDLLTTIDNILTEG